MSEYKIQEKIDVLLENYFYFTESSNMNTDEKYSLAEKYLYQENNEVDIRLYEQFHAELTQNRDLDTNNTKKRNLTLSGFLTKKKKIAIGMNITLNESIRDISPLKFYP